MNAGAGVYLGFLTESTLRVEADDLSPGIEDIDYATSYKSFDYGTVVRASLEFKLLSFLALEGGVNYSVGLKGIGSDEFFTKETLKNKSLYAGVGLRFYLAGK